MFCRSALLLSFYENRFCLSQLIKKLNSTERGAPFRHFCVSKVITTAHAHKSHVIFHFFSKSFQTKQKIKPLRPKMTKIASMGSCLKFDEGRCLLSTFLRFQGDHYCACAQKWCHFSYWCSPVHQSKGSGERPYTPGRFSLWRQPYLP